MACNQQCDGCALKDGAAANCEPLNALKAQLCVLGAIPFWCHSGQDWRGDALHLPMARADFLALTPTTCAGWRAEVRRLAATGYYDKERMAKRVTARWAIRNLDIIGDNPDDCPEKTQAHEAVRDCVVLLTQLRGLTEQQCKGCDDWRPIDGKPYCERCNTETVQVM